MKIVKKNKDIEVRIEETKKTSVENEKAAVELSKEASKFRL